tara:strand:- start:89 stop:3250 length:3162 start_codon:yes stop_codon:yes gene_type:complete
MGQFNNRVFGSNIHPKVKNKLKAKQILASTAHEPNQSIQSTIQKEGTPFTKLNPLGEEEPHLGMTAEEAIGNRNFTSADGKGSVLDLSSRTPWTRMWTAVQMFYYEKGGERKFITETEEYNVGYVTADNIRKVTTGRRSVDKEVVKNELQIPMESRVYEIGNHIFNNETDKQDPTAAIFNQGSRFGELSSTQLAGDPSQFLKTEMQTNEFLKPPAGITSITSTTDGPLGAIKRTTINFVVHNFHDYENIYMKYFLRPGALVVLDFGWDTSLIYNPQDEIIKQQIPLTEALFGDNGYVVESKGDLEVIVGNVTDYSSKVRVDGGFDCSIQITSANDAIIDKELSDRNKLKDKFTAGIGPLIINRAAAFLGESFLRNDWGSSPDNLQESREYANTFASDIYGGDSNVVNISDISSLSGVYWQNLDEESKTISDGDTNIYVSWGFFEEEILNKELALQRGELYDFGARFDSSKTFVRYETNLINRQKMVGIVKGQTTDLKFLYPEKWNKTFFTSNAKKYGYTLPIRPEEDSTPEINDTFYGSQIDLGYETGEVGGGGVTDKDKKAKRIPLREIFINLSVVSDAFKSNNDVNDAIKQILDVINEDSYDVFNLKLAAGNRDYSTLSVIDDNKNSIRDDGGDSLLQNMFVFNPHSPNTIVKSMDLSYVTPKGGHQSMLAIQNTDVNIPLFTNSKFEDSNQSLRQILAEANAGLGIRYLPELRNDFTDKEMWSYVTEVDTKKSDKAFLEQNPEDDSLIQSYKSLLNASQRDSLDSGSLAEGADDLGNYELDISGKSYGDYKPEDEINSIDPNVIYAADLNEYFGFKSKKNYLELKTPTPLPIELTLTIYGVSSLMPGDIFTIDYLPRHYKESVYFQVMQINHEVNNQTWSTTLQTSMRIQPNKKQEILYKTPRKIRLSPSFFSDNVSPRLVELFSDFDLYYEAGTQEVLVFTAKGKIKGGYRKIDYGFDKEAFRWDDEGNFSNGILDAMDESGWVIKNDKGAKIENIVQDETYYVVAFLGGGLVYKSEDFKNPKDIIDNITKKIYTMKVGVSGWRAQSVE